ncbi:hypothetical protein B0T22DRAFT_495314 [Podospora appendiculata]|uniref:DUF7719 domain-containing protein n=1 Tax=Podospora appendiculata TaxID=314037 RepID=A0AAE0XER2_9PEZI|nr:hypothetical protein B0T22DRAFT_495314 [Podospora appendiculata]
MARKRAEKSPADSIQLKHADRSGPTKQTLLELADQRGLFEKAKQKQEANDRAAGRRPRPAAAQDADADTDDEDEGIELPPLAERILETMLWSVSLSVLHFTLDVLVQHQYSPDSVSWPKVCIRTAQALLVFGMLFYVLHLHPSSPTLLPGLPKRFQPILRQAIFFAASVCAGCYLIHITNAYGYLAVMKQAPSVGCLWVWSVIELDLPWAVLSLAGAGAFIWQKGYSIW